MKSAFYLAATAAALFSVAAAAKTPLPATSASIAAAVADSHRPEKDTQQDAVRRPADLVAFSKVKPGDVVMDVWPGGGYWTRLFSPIVGAKGKVYAYVPAEIASFKTDPVAVAKALAAEPGRTNVEAISDPIAQQPAPSAFNTFDVIWTFENYHDLHDSFMKGASVDGFNQAVFKLLKPGGYFVVVDHASAPGAGLKNTEDLHRIDPATVKAEVEKAGFVLDAESTLLASSADDHTLKIFDPAVKGKTDRFMLRFKKPAK
ncbi:putative methyltransferase [Luteibacter sp. OK325]|uniref:class I SAM-dependent methyltransferase n=1 Tax=Luteibacter sp. OK325 TaxID=2135670 RepID=UPI000D4807B8|nr:methyltransferase [Luteibacter sp. OK325]PTR34148.1 putative methyltransferase [Luteibacter sp. OK325]